jgi:nucleoside-diphosphate-sugar epimerase
VIAVSRFGDAAAERALRERGIETIRADLADQATVSRLPEAPNVVFMAGQKFGTSDEPGATWIANVVVPALAAERYAGSRIVAFSTGNVYPLVPASSRGARESVTPAPVGEYASSCLGRERIFEHYAQRRGTRVAIVRLNYAVDLRYGVLVDVATSVRDGRPVDVRMGWVNVIWQGDANARALQCLPLATSPPLVLNVTGPERVSIREVAHRFGERFGRPPVLEGTEASDALLSDAARSVELFGPPAVPLDTLVEWVADWVARGGSSLGRPTHFEERRGRY